MIRVGDIIRPDEPVPESKRLVPGRLFRVVGHRYRSVGTTAGAVGEHQLVEHPRAKSTPFWTAHVGHAAIVETTHENIKENRREIATTARARLRVAVDAVAQARALLGKDVLVADMAGAAVKELDDCYRRLVRNVSRVDELIMRIA